MHLINFEVMDELLKKVVKDELIRKPSKAFTDNVMNEIFELKVQKQEKPLIAKWVWYVLGTLVVLITVFGALNSPQPEGKYSVDIAHKMNSFISSIHIPTVNLSSNINLYVIAGGSLAMLLLVVADVVLFRKR